MPLISGLLAPSLPLSGLELTPGLQGGGVDANVGIPVFAYAGIPKGSVLRLRNPVLADLSATTDADPGAGKVRWNNADPDLATELYVDDVDTLAADLSSVWGALDLMGFVYLQASATSARRDTWQKFQVNAVSDETGYGKLGVTLVDSNGTFVADEAVEISFQQPDPVPGVNRNVVTAVSSVAGVVTIDCALGDYFVLTLTENVTGWVFSNVLPGCSIMLRIMQDAATARTVAWPASFRWVDGTDGVVSVALGARDRLAITTDDTGTTWDATLAKGFAA
jgi:hypothetical protein